LLISRVIFHLHRGGRGVFSSSFIIIIIIVRQASDNNE